MGLVFFQAVGVDGDVIKIGSAEEVGLLFAAAVDEVLEGCWFIDKAEWHHSIFQMSISCLENCFPFLSLAYSGLVIVLVEGEFCVLLRF